MRVTDVHSGLTQARLKSLLLYDPASGVFTWINPGASQLKAGDLAGYLHQSGYRVLKIDSREYHAARLAWLYMTGGWPAADVDHKNLNKSDTRWENLRAATRKQNSANRGATIGSTTGFRGVYRQRRARNPYVARIRVDGKLTQIGVFPTAEDANVAYVERARALYGEFARG